MDTEIQEEGADGGHRDSCARPDPADCDGARDNDIVGQSGMRSHSRLGRVSPACRYQHNRAVAEGDIVSCTPSGVPASAEEVLGEAFLGTALSGGDDGDADR